MKRIVLGLLLVLVVSVFILPHKTSAQNVNNFTITNYDIVYNLSRDSNGYGILKTKETITAVFPTFDQNHGLERAIPIKYDGHKLFLQVDSIKDSAGNNWEFSTYEKDGMTVLRIGSAYKYVHGEQTFIIEYTQHAVTKYFKDGNKDEFYWDTNGTDWKVPIRQLNVRLNIDPALVDKLSGDKSCYRGAYSSTNTCQIDQGTNGVFTTGSTSLYPGENITIAVGFTPHAFNQYKPTMFESLMAIWKKWQLISILIAVVLLIFTYWRFRRIENRKDEIGTIIPEYLAPRHISVGASSYLIGSAGKASTAQLIDLAVRHYIKIIQTERKSFFSKKKDYEIELIKQADNLLPDEKEILNDLFDNTLTVGNKLSLTDIKSSFGIQRNLIDNPKKIADLMTGQYQLRTESSPEKERSKKFGLIIIILGIVCVNIPLVTCGFMLWVVAWAMTPLTDKGLETTRYLKGLEMYIKLAEADRLKALQSPDGADKVPVDTNDTSQVVKLYEKLLPYAIIFGQEKQWYKDLGKYYEGLNSQPEWFTGSDFATGFSVGAFSSAMNNFSSFSSSSTSFSSSSGSSGGGSSGGGGGGGGGGGW